MAAGEGLVMLRIIAGLVLLSGPALADCTITSSLAEQVMTARQIGIPRTDMHRVVAVLSQGDEDLHRPVSVTFRQAYARPRYLTDEIQELAINSFRDQAAAECYRKSK